MWRCGSRPVRSRRPESPVPCTSTDPSYTCCQQSSVTSTGQTILNAHDGNVNIILKTVITIFGIFSSTMSPTYRTSPCVSRGTDQEQHTQFVECRQIQSLGRNTLTLLVIGEQPTAIHRANPGKPHFFYRLFYHHSVLSVQSPASVLERKTKQHMIC